MSGNLRHSKFRGEDKRRAEIETDAWRRASTVLDVNTRPARRPPRRPGAANEIRKLVAQLKWGR
jgi:hypothetical protein